MVVTALKSAFIRSWLGVAVAPRTSATTSTPCWPNSCHNPSARIQSKAFCGVVDGLETRSSETGHRAEEGHAAATAVAEAGTEMVGQMRSGAAIHGQHVIELVGVPFEEVSERRGGPGVEDEQADIEIRGRVLDSVDDIGRSQIQRHCLDLDRIPILQLTGEGDQRLRPPSDQDDVHADRRKMACKGLAGSFGTTGDHRPRSVALGRSRSYRSVQPGVDVIPAAGPVHELLLVVGCLGADVGLGEGMKEGLERGEVQLRDAVEVVHPEAEAQRDGA